MTAVPVPVSVLEFAAYRRRADQLLTSEQRDAIIDLIAYEPTCGDIIRGSAGLRKVRVGRDGIGKRGGARVIYYFYKRVFRFCWSRSMPKMKKTI
jgi:hypothetical protein